MKNFLLFFSPRFGFFATAVLTFVAGLASAASPNYLSLLLLRGFVGIGLGGGPVISAWFMEFVPSANRGLWMVIISLFWTLGSIAEASLAWVMNDVFIPCLCSRAAPLCCSSHLPEHAQG
jgi:MFS family permease